MRLIRKEEAVGFENLPRRSRLGCAAQTTIRERFDADESAQQLLALFRERALA